MGGWHCGEEEAGFSGLVKDVQGGREDVVASLFFVVKKMSLMGCVERDLCVQPLILRVW